MGGRDESAVCLEPTATYKTNLLLSCSETCDIYTSLLNTVQGDKVILVHTSNV